MNSIKRIYLDLCHFLSSSSERGFPQLNKFLGRAKNADPSKFITLGFASLRNLNSKNNISRGYHFLGSVYFAIFLIGTTALMVIIGTFIESATQSHQSASELAYGSPVFMLLLCGFFINILFSALRRWPFKKRHIPFLITHWGLLMVILGIMVKSISGIQGTLLVTEGGGSHDLFLGNTEALRVEHQRTGKVVFIPLNSQLEGIQFQVMKRVENSQELLTPWFQGNQAIIRGLNPLTLYTLEEKSNFDTLRSSGRVRFFSDDPTYTDLYALETPNGKKAIEALYTSHAKIKVTDTVTQKTLGTYPLNQMLQSFVPIGLLNLSADLDLSTVPTLHFSLNMKNRESLLEIPLSGPKALLNQNQSSPYLGALPLTLAIEIPPMLVLIKDPDSHRSSLYAIDPHGAIWESHDDLANMPQVLAYNDGFAGYSIQKTLPWKSFDFGREEKEKALHKFVAEQLDASSEMIKPLMQFKNATLQTGTPFGTSFMTFLEAWNAHNTWAYPSHVPLPEALKPIFEQLTSNWSQEELEAAFLTTLLFSRYDPILSQEIDPIVVLKQERWPLTASIQHALSKHENKEELALTLLTQQLIQAAKTKTENKRTLTPEEAATGFSALLRSHGISLKALVPNLESNEFEKPLILETPIKKSYLEKPPLAKLEDNIPAITLLAKTPNSTEVLHLTFDKRAHGLCWGCGEGEYLVRFQPKVVAIPYHIRLRQARQINYPNTTQPYSYEADLVIRDGRTGELVEKTISMNHVHETKDHYRFYLSAIYPQGEGVVKTVQIVVNQDPAKYWLTYPGALILSIGILSLFWMKSKEGKTK